MTHDLHKTTQQLIKDIERKDRRFRMAQSTFMVTIMLVLAGIIFAQFQTLQRVQDQLEGQKSIIQEFKKCRR